MQKTTGNLHTNQNGMSLGVRCFDLGHFNLSAQLKALAAAIRFSGSSCFMLEGKDDSGGWDAEVGFACQRPQDSSTKLTGD